jgi:hypothetical protein
MMNVPTLSDDLAAAIPSHPQKQPALVALVDTIIMLCSDNEWLPEEKIKEIASGMCSLS